MILTLSISRLNFDACSDSQSISRFILMRDGSFSFFFTAKLLAKYEKKNWKFWRNFEIDSSSAIIEEEKVKIQSNTIW